MGGTAAQNPAIPGYQTLREIGRGGMGVVLLAVHESSGRRYAVKVMHDTLADDHELRDRMRLEAEAIRALRSPNVIQVYESGFTLTGAPYLVLELLEGRSLRDELNARGALSVVASLRYAIQLFDALDACHGAGILHRDVKPENLFICDGAEPKTLKLMDFGITKVFLDRVGGARPLEVPTAAGLTIGTPRWCSPEALIGDPTLLVPASDVYSAGLVVHYMVTGKLPWWHHRTLEAITVAQVKEQLPPLGSPDLAWLDVLIARMTAKRAEERFDSASEVASILRQCLRDRFGEEIVLMTTEPLPIDRSPAARPVITAPKVEPAANGKASGKADVETEVLPTPVELVVPRARRRPPSVEDHGSRAVELAVWALAGVMLAIAALLLLLVFLGALG